MNLLMLALFNHFSAFQRSLISAFAGFFTYGAWAYYVNSIHGHSLALKASLVQGMNSFFLTLVMSLLMEQLFKYLEQGKLRFFITFLSSACGVCLFSWSVNYLAGTPEIIMTILPGCVISTFYAFSYTVALQKSR